MDKQNPLEEIPSRETFIEMTTKAKFCTQKQASELYDKLSVGNPGIIHSIITICRIQDFGAIGVSIFYTIDHLRGDEELGRMAEYLNAISLQEKDNIKLMLDIVKEFWHKNEWKFLSTEAGMNKMKKVIEGFRANYPKGATSFLFRGLVPSKFFELEVVLDYSSEKSRDLEFVNNYKLSYQANPETLTFYYRSGHRYICHTHYWGKPGSDFGRDVPREEIHLWERVSKMENYPSIVIQERIIKKIFELPKHIIDSISEIFIVFIAQSIDLSFFEKFLSQISLPNEISEGNNIGEELPNNPMIRIISAVIARGGEDIASSLGVLIDVISLCGESIPEDIVEDFENGNIANLEGKIFGARMKEHNEKFPEKPLEEVYEDFQSQGIETEKPNNTLLTKSFAIYEKILREGSKLIGMNHLQINTGFTEEVLSHPDKTSEEYMVAFFAYIRELFKHHFGVYPYNTQIIALILLFIDTGEGVKGRYEQIRTGEGKSLIFTIGALYMASRGHTVDVITSNPYLARRDALRFQGFIEKLGMSVDAWSHHDGSALKKDKKADILYTTNNDLIFTYLASRLGQQEYLHGRTMDVAMVDEADNLCIDMTNNACRIASDADPIFSEEQLRSFIIFADLHEKAIRNNLPQAIAEFKKFCRGAEEVHPIYIGIYLQSALRSKEVVLNEDYIIDKEEVVIVDVHNTGRIQKKTQWGQGLHEFVALRNNLPIPSHKGVQAQMNHPSFLRRYDSLYCISGTFGGAVDRREIREVYGLEGFDIPSHHPSIREDLGTTLLGDNGDFESLVIEKILEQSNNGRPVLLITSSIQESVRFATIMRDQGLKYQLLNDQSSHDLDGNNVSEDDIIGKAGGAGVITISTSVAGRGADIIPDKDVIEKGGVYVLLTFIPFNKRVEFQGRGRAGRQGKPGSSEIVANFKSDLFINSLGSPIQKTAKAIQQRYGSESRELECAIEIARRMQGLIASERRKKMIMDEEILDEAMERYFTTLIQTRINLQTKNLNLHDPKSEGATSFIVSEFLGDTWTRGFDYIRIVMDNDDAPDEMSEVGYDNSIVTELSINTLLQFGFTSQFGVQQRDFYESIGSMVKYYEHAYAYYKRKLEHIDRENISSLVESLEAQVKRASEECERKFGNATVFDLKQFIDERLKRKKGDSNGE